MPISRKAKKELCWILLFLACAPLVYLLVFGTGGYLRLREYRERLQEIQEQNRALRQKRSELLARINKIRTDPAAMERIARQRHNLARSGDIVVTIKPAEEAPKEKSN